MTGGTGLIGSQVSRALAERGDEVLILSRSLRRQGVHPKVQVIAWDDVNEEKGNDIFAGVEAVINLAGETINQRWTAKAKRRIKDSRLQTTSTLIRWIENGVISPKVFISASAVGYYGTSARQGLTEEQQPGSDFLADVTSSWERAAVRAEQRAVRTVLTRFGVVLDKEGGAFPKMMLPYKLHVGGRVGKGGQWLSWIHIDDVVRLMLHVLDHDEIRGPVNFTAPQPVSMDAFGRAIASAMQRKHWLPVPSLALKALLGEMSILLLEGQHVLPDKALQHGFEFLFTAPDQAVVDLL